MNTTPKLTAKELSVLNEAEELAEMRQRPAFQRIATVLQSVADAARTEMEQNGDPRWDGILVRAYRERKRVVDFLQQYIDAVIANRRSTVIELLKSMGVPEDVAERNQDMSLSFLMQQGGPLEQAENTNGH